MRKSLLFPDYSEILPTLLEFNRATLKTLTLQTVQLNCKTEHARNYRKHLVGISRPQKCIPPPGIPQLLWLYLWPCLRLTLRKGRAPRGIEPRTNGLRDRHANHCTICCPPPPPLMAPSILMLYNNAIYNGNLACISNELRT